VPGATPGTYFRLLVVQVRCCPATLLLVIGGGPGWSEQHGQEQQGTPSMELDIMVTGVVTTQRLSLLELPMEGAR